MQQRKTAYLLLSIIACEVISFAWAASTARPQELNITLQETTDSDESSEEDRAIGGKAMESGTTVTPLAALTTAGETNDDDKRFAVNASSNARTPLPPLAD